MAAQHDDPEARAYWIALLADAVFTQVPRLRPATSSVPDVRRCNVVIAHDLSEAITALASRRSVPIHTILLAAHVLVLSQLAGQADVVTGCTHRDGPDEEETSPFRVNVDAHSWAALIGRVFEAEAGLRPFRPYPLTSINRDLQTTAPLFEGVFDFTSSDLPRRLQRDAEIDPVDGRVQPDFVLRAEFSHNADANDIALRLSYLGNLLDEDHIERIGAYYRRALELMTADVARPGAQSLLSDDETHRVSVLFNQTDTDQDFSRLAHRYVEDQVERAPGRIAIRCREHCWSYELLNQRANRVARELTALNLPDESCVAVYMDRNPDWAATVLGVFKAGLVYVPVEPMFPEERAGQLIEQSRCRAVITERAHEAKLVRTLANKDLSCDILLAADIQEGTDLVPNPAADFDSTRLAYVFFTSGSTGVPKGAAIEHRGMVNHLFAKIHDLEMTEADTVAQSSPLGFDISVWQLLTPLMIGASVVIYDQGQVLDVVGLLGRLEADHVSVFETVPSYFSVMLDALDSSPVEFGTLRYLVLNAEVLAPSDVRRWCARYPGNRLVNAYGATECSDDVTHYHLPGPADARIPVGRPLQNMKIHVLDRHGQYVPPGTPGEICCTGVGVGRGYLNLPEESARAFVTDPRGAVHGRMYRTGDIGCWTVDGDLHFLGRRDEQVKVRGFRIELDEIEHVLLACPNVRSAAVVPRERAGGHELVAFIVSSGTTPDTVAAFLKARLPDYMAPSHFIEIDALPLSANGKVNRRLLRSRATLLDRTESPGERPLRVLAPAEAVAEHTLVCFPSAARDAFSFQAFADAVRSLRPDYQVIGVEYERGQDSNTSQFSSKVMSYLQVRRRELSILGHGTGVAPALALAAAAERTGKNPAAVFLYGDATWQERELRLQIDEIRNMSVSGLLKRAAQTGDLAGLEALTPAEAEAVAEKFRWDTIEAKSYLLSVAVQGPEAILDTPIVHVSSSDGPATREEHVRASRWSRLSRKELRQVRLDGGGHDFMATRSRELASAVVAHIEANPAQVGEEIVAEDVMSD